MNTHINFDPAIWGEVSPEERASVLQELSKPLPPTDTLSKGENLYKGPPMGSDDDLDMLLDQD